MFDVVVIATDGSERSARAEDAGLDLAGRFDASVHAIAAVAPDADPDRETVLRGTLDDLAGRADRPVDGSVRGGEPIAVIRAYVDEVGADLIVMGTRGRGDPHRFHLGSTAEAIVREAPMLVLTVRGTDGGNGDSGDPTGAEGGRGRSD